MINTNPHTDLTNPQNYEAHIIKGLTREQQQELNGTHGVIKIMFHTEFSLVLKLDSTFVIQDNYGNELYICKYKQKDKMFELTDTNKFYMSKTLREFDVMIRTHFKRKPTNLV